MLLYPISSTKLSKTSWTKLQPLYTPAGTANLALLDPDDNQGSASMLNEAYRRQLRLAKLPGGAVQYRLHPGEADHGLIDELAANDQSANNRITMSGDTGFSVLLPVHWSVLKKVAGVLSRQRLILPTLLYISRQA